MGRAPSRWLGSFVTLPCLCFLRALERGVVSCHEICPGVLELWL